MMLEVRIVVVALAAFAGVSLLTSIVVLPLAGRGSAGPAAVRARRLADLRLLPAAAAAVASLIVLAAFAAFEPRLDGERAGWALPLLAVLAIVLVASSLWRACALLRATDVTTRAWLAAAQPIQLTGISAPAFAVDTDFPVVTVVGCRRPRLIIARSVLASCSEEELRAILAHEQGHIDRRDNLRRLLMGMAPDVITWLPLSARMLAGWREAAEDAADDDAVKCGTDGTLWLAQALVKVARLAPESAAPFAIPASALYCGESIDRRVRRLVTGREPAATAPPRAWILPAAAAIATVASIGQLESIHGVVEGLIHTLP